MIIQLENIYSDIFISIERVTDNAKDFNVVFEEELNVLLFMVYYTYVVIKTNRRDEKLNACKEN